MIRSIGFALLVTSIALAATPASADDPSKCSAKLMFCGTRVSAEITAGTCPVGCKQSSNMHFLNVPDGSNSLVEISVTGYSFAATVILYDGEFRQLAEADASSATNRADISRVLLPGDYYIQVIGGADGTVGSYSLKTTCTPGALAIPCLPGDKTLCFNSDRFSATVSATDPRTGTTTEASARPGNDVYGFFSFPALTFNKDNPEIFVKIIDGRAFNGNWWVFYSALTDLNYRITIRDTKTNRQKVYTNTSGTGIDIDTFKDN